MNSIIGLIVCTSVSGISKPVGLPANAAYLAPQHFGTSSSALSDERPIAVA
jgi:hypothetical protein